MKRAVSVFVVLAAGLVDLRADQSSNSPLQVTIAQTVYQTDGGTSGGTGSWKLDPGGSFVTYPHWSQLCSPGLPETGWKVEVTLVSRDATRANLRVSWGRTSEASAAYERQIRDLTELRNGMEKRGSGTSDLDYQLTQQRIADLNFELARAANSAQSRESLLMLKAGDHVLLDYIPGAGGHLVGAAAGQEGALSSRACDVVGMGLEVRLDPPQHPPVLETDIWLVRTPAGGADDVQHQVIRSEARTGSGYWFDEVNLAAGTAPPDASQATAARLAIRVSGTIVPVESTDGRIHLKLTIERASRMISTAATGGEKSTSGEGGGATYDVSADPGEVVAFQLPPILVRGQPVDRLSVRVRSHWLK